MNKIQLKELADLLTAVANAPMSDSVFALQKARRIVYSHLLKKTPQQLHGIRVEARQKESSVSR